MGTAFLVAIVLSPFAVAASLAWAARRSRSLRLHPDQFRFAAPMGGRLFADHDASGMPHDPDAVRRRFERQPSWPRSGATGERR